MLSLIALALIAQTPTDTTKVDKAKPQETAAAPPTDPPPEVLIQEAQGSLGGLFTNGNVDSIAGRASGYYQLKYWVHGFRVDVGAGVASIASDPDLDPANGKGVPLFDEKNTLNTLGNVRARYDFFLTDLDSIYGAGMIFHDSAANLQLRMRADVGYRRYFFHSTKHALSAEVGAVYTIDRAPFAGDTNGDGKVDLSDNVSFEKNNGTLGARLFVGYSNALRDDLAFNTSLEVVPNIFPEVDAPYEAGDEALGLPARVDARGDNKLGIGEATIANFNATLSYTLIGNLSIGTSLLATWDNGAVARRNAYTNHDIALTVQLAYKLF